MQFGADFRELNPESALLDGVVHSFHRRLLIKHRNPGGITKRKKEEGSSPFDGTYRASPHLLGKVNRPPRIGGEVMLEGGGDAGGCKGRGKLKKIGCFFQLVGMSWI